MYKKILVPVDLSHMDKIPKTLSTAIDMAKHYQASLCYVTVTNSTPGAAAHNPKELAEKLAGFAHEQGQAHGIKTDAKVLASVDTAVELDSKLLGAIKDTGADLVVMASHTPGLGDKLHLLRSNAAEIVKHSDISVFVVR
ncbi:MULTISPECIES: universal stress protein [Marinobacter]|jgi:nucleotide-binding universal stress UspA family protein|uniref:Universal stress protein n=1 Tax=Marinobacter vinifirmus TaxID=355591 RepID=A0A558B730_9GAMM|nr:MULTISPECIES: universal stress protein [Marinobacter]TVT32317.1 MAG: universal stress protein [Marinobacter vinifirmus]|tara:strand:- start:177 stop:596 length:420 start_codon:yes stop_codon:yes gene_type:complete